MAGHSKFANIKHRKAAQDAKRGKVFTKLIRELVVAAKEGGGAPEDNPRLRLAIDKSLGANMKKDTIEKAIQRGAGGGEGEHYDELTYEGYAPGGTAILVETMTDNVNRTVSAVRAAFSKSGGNMGTAGSVAYLFDRKGQLTFDAGVDEEQIMELALESGADDVITNDDGSIDVFTDHSVFLAVKAAFEGADLTPVVAEVSMIPSTSNELDVDAAKKLLRLIDVLEDLDDVQEVYHNGEIPEAAMEE
ncbi:MAG: YebC/PmpR family DNA-binding transcriptional regulator [Motiliproteus sp.]